jgi:hypothetical protein
MASYVPLESKPSFDRTGFVIPNSPEATIPTYALLRFLLLIFVIFMCSELKKDDEEGEYFPAPGAPTDLFKAPLHLAVQYRLALMFFFLSECYGNNLLFASEF